MGLCKKNYFSFAGKGCASLFLLFSLINNTCFLKGKVSVGLVAAWTQGAVQHVLLERVWGLQPRKARCRGTKDG